LKLGPSLSVGGATSSGSSLSSHSIARLGTVFTLVRLAKEDGEVVINGGYKLNSGKHSTGTFSLLLVRNKARAQKEIDSV
jgi:hypothetical protein